MTTKGIKTLWTAEEARAIGAAHAEVTRLEAEYQSRYAGTGAEWDTYEKASTRAEAMLTRSLRPVLRRIDRATDTIAAYERLEIALWAEIEANN